MEVKRGEHPVEEKQKKKKKKKNKKTKHWASASGRKTLFEAWARRKLYVKGILRRTGTDRRKTVNWPTTPCCRDNPRRGAVPSLRRFRVGEGEEQNKLDIKKIRRAKKEGKFSPPRSAQGRSRFPGCGESKSRREGGASEAERDF